MKFKVKEFFKDMKEFFLAVIIFALLFGGYFHMVALGQEKPEVPVKAKDPKYQTWKLPIYMQENLQWMLDDFNKRFEEKVQSYKKELQTRFAEFKDMPDDAVLYLEGGMFINRADFLKLQRYMRDIEEIRNKQKTEVKKDGK